MARTRHELKEYGKKTRFSKENQPAKNGRKKKLPAPFTMKPGDIKTFTIPPDKSITVKGDFQSPFAHNDFNRNYICEGEGNCGSINVILKQ